MSDRELHSLLATHKSSRKMAASDVEATPGAVGLVDVSSIKGNINVVKVDGKLPTEEGYLPH
jgi:hypothetical protein